MRSIDASAGERGRRPPPIFNAAMAASILDPVVAAREAGLHYVSDGQKGISRRRRGVAFFYQDSDGKRVIDVATLARIRTLAIPPAYQEVWICRDPQGHLQAVGRDARGRKQYRYHPQWRVARDEAKYAKLLTFARVLPHIRNRVEQDLELPGLPKEKVLAAIVCLLERTLARIGNREYARTNNSFGLTTLRNRHVKIAGGQLVFDFRAKHGIQRHIDLEDRRLARIVKKCQDLPGQELFQYRDDEGAIRAVGSDDINNYLRTVSGEEITAKDFRTWAGTKLAVVALRHLPTFESQTEAKKNVVEAVAAVAKMLGNTAAICRKCYIHPIAIESYLAGTLPGMLKRCRARARGSLSADEAMLVKFLTLSAERKPTSEIRSDR
jgi:DNA topoisomerase-1